MNTDKMNGLKNISCFISRRQPARPIPAAAYVVAAALAFVGAAPALHAKDATLIPLDSNASMVLFTDDTAPFKHCLAGDISEESGILPAMKSGELAPGFYRAEFLLRLSHTVSCFTERTRITVSVSGDGITAADREMSVICFDRPGIYQRFELPFTVTKPSSIASFQVSWAWKSQKSERRPVPLVNAPKPGDTELQGADSKLDNLFQKMVVERKISEFPYHIALGAVGFESLGEVALSELEVNKVRYRPNEALRGSVTIRNAGIKPRELVCIADLIDETHSPCEIARGTALVPARGAHNFEFSGPVGDRPWGREISLRVEDGSEVLVKESEYFTVHTNMWAVAIGAFGMDLPRYRAGPNGVNAPKIARDCKQRYENVIEFVFWAPDDTGDLNPPAGQYWSGQLRRDSSGDSTRWLIDAFHEAGVACSVYTTVWVYGGKSGYESYRRHPEWFNLSVIPPSATCSDSVFDVRHLDRWDSPPGTRLRSWPRIAPRTDIDEPYEHHAGELIRSIENFGWDAARYDSDTTKPDAPRVFTVSRNIVNTARPEFQWGYNDGLHRTDLSDKPNLQELYDFICSNGAMIMDEYNRHAAQDKWTYEKYAHRHVIFRDQVHTRGGHVVFCPLEINADNDAVFQEILPLAARAHHAWNTLKGPGPYANYARFSTLHAGRIWDNSAIRLESAAKRIDWGASAEKLFMPNDYVYLRPIGKDRSELIIQMLNRPPEKVASYNDNRVPLPVEDAECVITLPEGVIPKAAWLATAEPVMSRKNLDFSFEKGALGFTVPYLRFWNMLVIELEGEGDWK